MNSSPLSGTVPQALDAPHTAETPLLPGIWLHHCADWVTLRFEPPRRALSCAVVGGGLGQTSRWLNLRVSGDHCGSTEALTPEAPATTVARLCRSQGWSGDTMAMMTAASMKSLRIRRATLGGETLAVLATTGLANARRAGDRAEHRVLGEAPVRTGTINLAVITSAGLNDAALVEAVAIATEAKAAALQDQGIRSPVSGAIATGTGTDAIAVFSGCGPAVVHYAGKHTLFGEVLAKLTLAAVGDSIRQAGPLDDELHSGECS